MQQDSRTVAAIKRSNTNKLRWGLICLIAPTALIIISLVLYALVNFIFSATAGMQSQPYAVDCTGSEVSGACLSEPQTSQEAQLFNGSGIGRTIANVALFLVSALSVATWLPGIIVGIVLLANRKPIPRQ